MVISAGGGVTSEANILIANPKSRFSAIVNGNGSATIGLTGTDRFLNGCTAGAAELSYVNWTIADGGTLYLKFDGNESITAMALNGSGKFDATRFSNASISDNSVGPSGQMSISNPDSVHYNIIMQFDRGPNGVQTT